MNRSTNAGYTNAGYTKAGYTKAGYTKARSTVARCAIARCATALALSGGLILAVGGAPASAEVPTPAAGAHSTAADQIGAAPVVDQRRHTPIKDYSG